MGARTLNESLINSIDKIAASNVQVIWQCGKFYFPNYANKQEYLVAHGVHLFEFIKEMDLAYAAADVIISRSGASSVSELCIVGKPTIFIPSPNVAEDHQTKNAKAIVDKKGAILLKENELNEKFETTFSDIISNENLQTELSQNIKKLGKPNATKDIVEQIIKLIK